MERLERGKNTTTTSTTNVLNTVNAGRSASICSGEPLVANNALSTRPSPPTRIRLSVQLTERDALPRPVLNVNPLHSPLLDHTIETSSTVNATQSVHQSSNSSVPITINTTTTTTTTKQLLSMSAGDDERVCLLRVQPQLGKRGETDLSIDKSGLQGLLPSCLRFAFADRQAEHLYREYYAKEKQGDLRTLVQMLLLGVCLLGLLYALQEQRNVALANSFNSTAEITSSFSSISSLSAFAANHHSSNAAQQLQLSWWERSWIPHRITSWATGWPLMLPLLLTALLLPPLLLLPNHCLDASIHTRIAQSTETISADLASDGRRNRPHSASSTTTTTGTEQTHRSSSSNVRMHSVCSALLTTLPYLLWVLLLTHFWAEMRLCTFANRSPYYAFVLPLFYTYAIYVVFPLRLRVVAGLALLAGYLQLWLAADLQLFLNIYSDALPTVDSTSDTNHPIWWRRLIANGALLLCVHCVGVMSSLFYEKRQRRAFLETCVCLEHKLQEQEQSQEQERLLLSVLPRHVAAEIRQDLGNVFSGQFKKIYMSRHENVSILFADIVGFTAISSTLPAPELVKILNELFARFDKLADKYHQLRIKILGDCYYCISGAPEQRSDHAVLCVHMGLSMVDAIISVREQTKSGVDMRVGIHTGGVLAGVLGQKQWQFDVYSKDVEFANKMESGGLPGRVHISQSTLKYLNGEFEVCEGDGSSREEAIRLAGIKTYFIVRVLKPYPQGTLDEHLLSDRTNDSPANGNSLHAEQQQSDVSTTTGNNVTVEPNGVNKKEEESQQLLQQHNQQQHQQHQQSLQANASSATQVTIVSTTVAAAANGHASTALAQVEPEEYTRRLRRELMNRDTSYLSKHMRPFTLCFRENSLERLYMNNSDETAGVSLVGMPVTLGFCLLARIVLGNVGPWELSAGLLCLAAMMVLCFCCTAPSWAARRGSAGQDSILLHSLRGSGDENTLTPLPANRSPSAEVGATTIEARSGSESRSLNMPDWLPRPILSISLAVQHNAVVRLVVSLLLIGLWLCWAFAVNTQLYVQQPIDSPTTTTLSSDSQSNGQNSWSLNTADGSVLVYTSFFCVVLLLGVSALKRISFLIKMAVIGVCVCLQCVANFMLHFPTQSSSSHTVHPIDWTLMLLSVAAACLLINRQFEVMSRRLFLWQREVQEQKDKVADMKRKNEALVYNILPPHVASHFLGRRSRDEELYSKSYDSVGVLFAAMPNFTDFYTEESVNNQGLECLRFLNEVISDFDALLDQPQFRDIIKIKTIGATYMAASGLNCEPEQEQKALERGVSPIKARWAHLATLTEFALTLKETLNNINRESFNNFVLKMGINQGPITAGVIGARKPHYDMWGNTVNVASRMESTGKAGCIQVVQETAQILEEFGYVFEQRGLVSVKGKGKLMTYYLIGKK